MWSNQGRLEILVQRQHRIAKPRARERFLIGSLIARPHTGDLGTLGIARYAVARKVIAALRLDERDYLAAGFWSDFLHILVPSQTKLHSLVIS